MKISAIKGIDYNTKLNVPNLVNQVRFQSFADSFTKSCDSTASEITLKRPSLIQINIAPNLFENYETKIILSEQARKLHDEFNRYIGEVQAQTDVIFGDIKKRNGIVTCRPKSSSSIFSKLYSKHQDGELTIDSHIDETCKNAINDGYGSRLQLVTISENEAKAIIENEGFDFDDFTSYIQECIDNEEIPSQEVLNVIEELKVIQTQPALDKLIEQRHNPKYKITEINNYGDELSSYFTYDQVKELAEALENPNFYMITKVKPDASYNTELSVDKETGRINEKFEMKNTNGDSVGIITEKGAVKKSGYASFQVNIEYLFQDKNTGFGELQIRSTKLNEFAEAEHIPYDIRQNKIKKNNKKYSSIYNLIKGMDENSYNNYNKYLTKVYKAFRMQELGLNIKIPELEGKFMYEGGMEIPDEELQKLNYRNLIEFHKQIK